MKIGKVSGNVVSTIMAPVFEARRLLICDFLDEAGRKKEGRSLIAVDTVGAGAGETVLILDEGNSARQVIDLEDAPIRAIIVGIVDGIDVDSKS
jgi:ethanolamine utilization protein EutN